MMRGPVSSVAFVIVALLLSIDPIAATTTLGAPGMAPAPAKRVARKSSPATHGTVDAAEGSAPAAKGGGTHPPAPAPTPTPAAAPAPALAPAPAPSPEDDRLLVERKCSKCHDVSLTFRAELSDAHWKLHMKRMASRPGAAITDEQAQRIHAYLKAMDGQADRARSEKSEKSEIR
jgi:hypothetical protein